MAAPRKSSHPSAKAPAEMRPEEAAFVEDIALLYQNFGAPRMMGRLLGWLLICEPPQQSMGQLQHALQASAGSISTVTRTLSQVHALKRMRVPGDRRDYFMIPHHWMSEMMASQNGRFERMRAVAAEGLKLLKDEPMERQSRLRELHAFATFMGKESPLQLAKWERMNKRT